MPWDFSCLDWEQRLRDGRTPIPELPLDLQEAERAAGIYNRLRLPDVPEQPTLGEAGGEWFRDIVRAAFGSLDPETGERRVAEIFALVPKKNSKTTNSAALGLVALLLNKRPNAEMMIVGPTQEVADLCFSQAQGMIDADPEGYLQRRFHVQDHLKQIRCRVHKAKLKIKTFDMKVMTGAKPVLAIIDELHIMAASAHAARVIGQIRGGLMPNPESLLVFITTQSDTPPAGVFKSELEYARGVRDGKVESARMLPVLYEFPAAMQADEAKPWRDPKNWPMVLPNLGRSITIGRLESEYRIARDKGDQEERRWVSQHLNVEMGIALHADAWVGTQFWTKAADPAFDLTELLATSDVCTVGIDGGGLDDLLGLAVIGRHAQTRRWRLWTKAWVHKIALERRKEIAPRLHDFAAAGELTICEEPTQDLIEVADAVETILLAGKLPKEHGVGLDPAGVAALVDELDGRGVNDGQAVAVSQGFRLAPAVWGLERKLQDGTFRHNGSGLMSWCVGNAKVEQRGNAVLITKAASGKAKIDPLIATFNAFMLMARNPVAAAPSGTADEYFAAIRGTAA